MTMRVTAGAFNTKTRTFTPTEGEPVRDDSRGGYPADPRPTTGAAMTADLPDGDAPGAPMEATLGECYTCGDPDNENAPEMRCPHSYRPCGHHCNHLLSSDLCHWCGAAVSEDGERLIMPAVKP